MNNFTIFVKQLCLALLQFSYGKVRLSKHPSKLTKITAEENTWVLRLSVFAEVECYIVNINLSRGSALCSSL